MDALDELVEKFKEVKSWKKQIKLVSALFCAVGLTLTIVGIFLQTINWIFWVFGGLLVIAGSATFLVTRSIIGKTERKVLEVLNSEQIPKSRREKAKSELGLK